MHRPVPPSSRLHTPGIVCKRPPTCGRSAAQRASVMLGTPHHLRGTASSTRVQCRSAVRDAPKTHHRPPLVPARTGLFAPKNYGNRGWARPTPTSTPDIRDFDILIVWLDTGFTVVRAPPHTPPLDRAALLLADSSLSPTPLQVTRRRLAADGGVATATSAGLISSIHPVHAGPRSRAVARSRQQRPGRLRPPPLAAGPRRSAARRPSRIRRLRARASTLARRRWRPRRVRPRRASCASRLSAGAAAAASAAASRASTRASRGAPTRRLSGRSRGVCVCVCCM